MAPSPAPFDAIAGILCYPDGGYRDRVTTCAAAVEGSSEDAAVLLSTFAAEVACLSREESEELYTRTFDLDPACTLDLGWHLFGEAYERGRFLVSLRGLLREHGVVETGELPDHLSHVLQLLPRMALEDAAGLATEAVGPALATMSKALESTANPYRHVLAAARTLVDEAVIGRVPEVCHD